MSVYNNGTKKLYDISQVVSDIKLSTYIEDQPGKLTFCLLKADTVSFSEGATVTLQVDSFNAFKGYVFTKKRNKNVNLISVTCYDQLRYLKNKDTYVLENLTSSEIFSRICKDFVLQYKVVDTSNFICSPRSNDGVALYDIIKDSLYDTLINTGKWYIIRDNFGTLEHINILSLVSNLVLGDGSGITDFDYETSIDKDVYNQIKLYRDNKTTKKREIFIVNDTVNGGNNLKKWGILQLYEKVGEELNIAQIESKARGFLKFYNSTRRTLNLESIGSFKITSGSIIRCKIEDLGDLSLDSYLLVTECTHSLENNKHTMTLTTEVVTS